MPRSKDNAIFKMLFTYLGISRHAMVRHNFSAFPLHWRRVISLLPESKFVPDIWLVLSQRVDTVCPAGLAGVASEVVSEVLTNAVTAAVTSLVSAAPPTSSHTH